MWREHKGSELGRGGNIGKIDWIIKLFVSCLSSSSEKDEEKSETKDDAKEQEEAVRANDGGVVVAHRPSDSGDNLRALCRALCRILSFGIDDDIHQIIILEYQQSALMTDFFLVYYQVPTEKNFHLLTTIWRQGKWVGGKNSYVL